MEPSDFDKFIKSKLQEDIDLHKRESEAAKPFVWSAVQNEVTNRSLNWRHLAAAMILLLIGFSLVFQMNRQAHQKELNHLAKQIGELHEQYQRQLVTLEEQDHQNDAQLLDSQKQELIVHRVDTIYRIRVDTVVVTVKEFVPVSAPTASQADPQVTENTIEKTNEVDESIYPHYTDGDIKRKTETIQLKFGALTARKD